MPLILSEIASYITIFLVWYLFRKLGKRNVTGDMIAGTMVGVFSEFAVEPLVDYHFKITFYKDTPVIIPIAWGMMFTLTTFLSEKLYYFFLKKHAILPKDKRIFIFDVLAGILVGFPLETIGTNIQLWHYRFDKVDWDWGIIPLLNMPLEVLLAYALIMLTAPTFVRYWQGAFEGRQSLHA
ncbi:MAG: hypothetical protein HY400_06020 [Elusimicrobia bacterium]|nr:hypothetical protein [Elusimicrobiota bacterium]